MKALRVAWLVPSIELGAYWQPVLAHFSQTIPAAVFYTGGVYPSYDPQQPGAALIEIVGRMQFVETQRVQTGYDRGLILLSPAVIPRLLRFKPDVVYPQAFSLWTLLVILFKPLGRWRVVIIHDGSSPNTDFGPTNWRTVIRRWMMGGVDGVLANTAIGQRYLTEVLHYPAAKILKRIYLVPDRTALTHSAQPVPPPGPGPVFLYVGRITERKGLRSLLEACILLKTQGFTSYTLWIIGTGEQREELEKRIKEGGIEAQVCWQGWVDYDQLGGYFEAADVFVFPTYEDVWGMVVSEAMVFGKPVICSQGAAACELIEPEGNGFVINPHDPLDIAQALTYFLNHPERIAPMGVRSRQIIAHHTPETAAQAFIDMTHRILEKP